MSVIINDIIGSPVTADTSVVDTDRTIFVAVVDTSKRLPELKDAIDRYMQEIGATELVVINFGKWLDHCKENMTIADPEHRKQANHDAIAKVTTGTKLDFDDLESVAGLFVDGLTFGISAEVRSAAAFAKQHGRPVFGLTGRI